jgi:hypothetical protein
VSRVDGLRELWCETLKSNGFTITGCPGAWSAVKKSASTLYLITFRENFKYFHLRFFFPIWAPFGEWNFCCSGAWENPEKIQKDWDQHSIDSTAGHQEIHPPSLYLQYQYKTASLLERQQDSQEKSKEALAISERILELNNQIIAENYKLASVEKDIAANSTIVEYICGNLKNITGEIEASALLI